MQSGFGGIFWGCAGLTAKACLINAFIPLVLRIAQLISHWLWSGDISRAEPGGGGAAAAAAVLAGAPEGSRPPEGHQEEEARLRPQVSSISCSQALDLLPHVLQPFVPFCSAVCFH